MKPLRCVIYARVSTEQQGDGTSLAGQTAACLVRAKAEGAIPIALIEETKSGGLYASRGELQKALALIESGEAQMLILSRLDRTGREVEALRDVRRRVEAAGAKLIFADGMTFEKGAVGNLLFTQLAGFAEFERELIRERTVAGLERAARGGRMPSRTVPAFGYTLVTKTHVLRGEYAPGTEGSYHIIKEEAPVILRIFQSVASGKSLESLARELDADGIKPRRAAKWAITSIRGIILNPVYKGAPQWRKTQRMVDEKRASAGLRPAFSRARPSSEAITLSAPPIVTPALWQRANDVMERGRAERSGNQAHRYLLAGFGRCPLCGDRLHSRLAVRRVAEEKNQRVWLYRCAGATRGKCDLPSFGGPTLEALVVSALTEFLENPSVLVNAQNRFVEEQKQKAADAQIATPLAGLRRKLESAQAKEKALAKMQLDAMLAGRDAQAIIALASEAETHRRTLESQIEAAQYARKKPLPPEINLPVATDISRLKRVLQNEALPVSDRAAILRELASRVYPVRFCDTSLPDAQQPQVSGKGQSTRTLAGVRLVIQTPGEESGQGPFFVVSRVVVNRTRVQSSRGYWKWADEWGLEVEISQSDPFPPLPEHCLPTRAQRENLA